jgi:hypothetical protein
VRVYNKIVQVSFPVVLVQMHLYIVSFSLCAFACVCVLVKRVKKLLSFSSHHCSGKICRTTAVQMRYGNILTRIFFYDTHIMNTT